MTMHEDPDLRLLEDDLRKLAERHEDDERLRLALGDQLAARSRTRRPRRRLSTRLTVGLAAGTAVAAITLVALVGNTGSPGPTAADAAIIRHALGAITPPANTILHVKVVGVQNGLTVEGETWQETGPPFANRGIKGPIGHQGEFGDDGTTSFNYDPSTNTIYEQPDSSRPTFADPVSQVRQELASGGAQFDGTVTIDGSALYRIDLPHGLVGYFEEGNYQPRYLDDPQRDGSVVRLRVVAYEHLPMTAANRQLLSVTAQHPTARIAAGSGVASGK
jgi:hypothetical protein